MQKSAKVSFSQPVLYRVAAVITLLMVAGVGVYWVYKNQQQANELAAIRKEMEATKQMMMAMMLRTMLISGPQLIKTDWAGNKHSS